MQEVPEHNESYTKKHRTWDGVAALNSLGLFEQHKQHLPRRLCMCTRNHELHVVRAEGSKKPRLGVEESFQRSHPGARSEQLVHEPRQISTKLP